MTKVLVPGAGGQIARWAVPMLAGRDREHQAGQVWFRPRRRRTVPWRPGNA